MPQTIDREKIKKDVLNELARDYHYSNFDYWERDEREALKQETRFWKHMITKTDIIKDAVDKAIQKTLQEIFNDSNKVQTGNKAKD